MPEINFNNNCSLKDMLLHGLGTRGDTQCQNLTTSLKKRGEYLKNEKFI